MTLPKNVQHKHVQSFISRCAFLVLVIAMAAGLTVSQVADAQVTTTTTVHAPVHHHKKKHKHLAKKSRVVVHKKVVVHKTKAKKKVVAAKKVVKTPTTTTTTTTTVPAVVVTKAVTPAVVATPAATNSAVNFYVSPNTDAAAAVTSLTKSGDTADATAMEKIASQSQAIWLVPSSGNQTTIVDQTLTAAKGAVPVFVLYAIPDRDCGSFSSGGLSTDAQYEAFVDQIAAGVKGRQAWFVVEPDALPMLDQCSSLTPALQADRENLLSYASATLSAVSSHVYLDAGNYDWQSASYIATVLKASGISYDAGFSLNVSSFSPTAIQEKYGNSVSALTGGKHFVIDTSRNGSSIAATTWCNPANQLLGVDPTTQTDDPLADGYLWIKTAGQSDGNCSAGAPTSGVFWLSYALGLAGA